MIADKDTTKNKSTAPSFLPTQNEEGLGLERSCWVHMCAVVCMHTRASLWKMGDLLRMDGGSGRRNPKYQDEGDL